MIFLSVLFLYYDYFHHKLKFKYMNFDYNLEEGEIDEQVIIKDDYMHKNQ